MRLGLQINAYPTTPNYQVPLGEWALFKGMGATVARSEIPTEEYRNPTTGAYMSWRLSWAQRLATHGGVCLTLANPDDPWAGEMTPTDYVDVYADQIRNILYYQQKTLVRTMNASLLVTLGNEWDNVGATTMSLDNPLHVANLLEMRATLKARFPQLMVGFPCIGSYHVESHALQVELTLKEVEKRQALWSQFDWLPINIYTGSNDPGFGDRIADVYCNVRKMVPDSMPVGVTEFGSNWVGGDRKEQYGRIAEARRALKAVDCPLACVYGSIELERWNTPTRFSLMDNTGVLAYDPKWLSKGTTTVEVIPI